MKPGATVRWLNAEEAAVHLGYVDAEGRPKMNAFYVWKHRSRPKAYRLGGRLRFRQVDLDRCVQPEVVERDDESTRPGIRIVGGRGR